MVVQTEYKSVPAFGLPGQITDIANARVVHNAPAQEDIPVARAVVKGDDIGSTTESNIMQEGYKVKLPIVSSVSEGFLGLSVRSMSLPGNPPNLKTSVPYYPADSPLSFLMLGSMWVLAEADIDASLKPVYAVIDDSNAEGLPFGALTPTIEVSKTIVFPGAFFAKKTKQGGMVKVVLLRSAFLG